MWYYELNQQPFGPVSQETISEELKAGRITPQTRVWREGWAEWRRLGETELAVQAGMTPPPVTAPVPPVYAALPQYKKISSASLSKLFWWWFGLTLGALPMALMTLFIQKAPWIMSLTCIFEIPLIAGIVLMYILIYKYWQIIQDGFARTTPGKAVGFSFIPFFNYYWMFVVYYGLCRDQNSYIKRHFGENPIQQVRKSHPALALSSMIVSILMILALIVLYIVIAVKAFTSFASPTEITSAIQPFSWIILIVYVPDLVLMMMMYFDIFLTSKSILKAEENKQ